MKKILLSIISIQLFVSASAQIYPHQLSLSPLSATDLGYGISAAYQYNFNEKIDVESAFTMNWSLSNLLYGPTVTHNYKSKILRWMPNVKYKIYNTSRFELSSGVGLSYGFGWDQLKDEGYSGTFHQIGALIDNSAVLMNANGNFGIGADLGFGYHFYNGVSEKYREKYDFKGDYLLRLGLKIVMRF